jgi:hypothetical protein
MSSSLEFVIGVHRCTEPVAVLPADTTIEVVSDQEGTLATLRHPTFCVRMRARDAPVQADGTYGNLFLPPEVHGRVVIDYTLAFAGTTRSGVWRIFAHPPATEVVDADGAVRDGEDDLSALRSGGGLRIYGQPRATVDVEIKDECWKLRLSPEGDRVFPFSEIPFALLNHEAEQKQVERLHVFIRRPGDEPRRRTFFIPQNERPFAEITAGNAYTPSRICVAWSRRAPAEVRLEVVRAWQPWTPSISLPARPVAWSGKSGYEVDLPLPAGPYQLALFGGERRLSGVRLVSSPNNKLLPTPSHLSPLEATLWTNTDVDRLAPLVRQWSDEGHDEHCLLPLLDNLTRFGSVKWFKIAEVLPEITGSWRLETLLRGDQPEALDRRVEEYYEQTGLAWMFVRDSDLTRVAGRLCAYPRGAANTLLARVAELDAGLLCPGARVWSCLLSCDGSHPDSAKAALNDRFNTYARPRTISPYERTLLVEADHELPNSKAAPDPDKVCVPRVLGLRQLNRYGDRVDERRSSIVDRAARPPPLNAAWFEQLPERLREHERAIAAWSWSVHRWRHGETMAFMTMRALSRLEPLAGKSFDYWLNAWDLPRPS